MAEHDRILGYFLEEADNHLNTIEQGLCKLAETVKQPAMMRELYRAAHSIVGSAAMLGLFDAQQIGKQFEANFKLLKEQPTIAVDNQLVSLFLNSFGFLRSAIASIKTSTDPYHRDPHSPDPVGDPVFAELKAYLQHLLGQIDEPSTIPVNSHQSPSQDPAIEQVFQGYVTRKLAEIVDLCYSIEQPDTRSQIQQICLKLGSLGDNFDFLEWTNLFTACRLAIANPHSSLTQLSESISIAVKQAQLLVLTDRHQEISITPDLEALIDRRLTIPEAQNISPAHVLSLDPSPVAGTSSSSIYGAIEPFQLEYSDNLADFSAVQGVEFDSGAMDIDDFMNNLLEEEIPDGTWMQDEDELGETDGFSLAELAQLELTGKDPFTTPRTEGLHKQILEPSAISQPVTLSSDKIVTDELSGDLEYDEETFFDPNFEEVDANNVANFWSSTKLSVPQPLYHADNIDLAANASSLKFQPEQSVEENFDTPLPDFQLDNYSISDLFLPHTVTGDWGDSAQLLDEQVEKHDLQPSSLDNQLTAHPAEHQNAEATPLSVGAVAAIATLAPLADSGSADILAMSNSDDDFGLDILATANASQDFTNLDLSSSTEFEQLGNSNEYSDSLAFEAFEPDVTPLVSISETQDSMDWLDSYQDADQLDDLNDLNLDILALNESVIDSLSNSSNELELDDLHRPTQAINLHQDLESSGLDLPTQPIDLSINNNFDDLPLDLLSHTEPVTDFSVSSGFEDPALGLINIPEPIGDFSFNSDSDELELDALTSAELFSDSVSAVSFDNSVFDSFDSPTLIEDLLLDSRSDDLELDALSSTELFNDSSSLDLNKLEFTDSTNNFDNLDVDLLGSDEPVADLGIDNNFDNLDVDLFGSDEPVADLGIDHNFDNLDVDLFGSDEPVADLGISNNFDNLDVELLNSNESVADLGISDNFDNLDVDLLDSTEAVVGLEIGNDFDGFNLDLLGNDESVAGLEIGSDFDNLELNLLDSTEPVVGLEIGSDFDNLEFDLLGNKEPSADLAMGNDFEGLDLDLLGSNELSLDHNFDGLDFDLNGANDSELLDLDNLLNVNVESNGMGDLDALLMGTAALGVGGVAIAAASTGAFDDLDALMGTPAPSVETSIDFNDLDGLLAEPAPTAVLATPVATDKPDRRSKQRTFEQTMRVSVRHLDNLNNLVGELVVNRNTLEQDQNRMRQFIEKLLSEVQKLNDVGKRMQDLYERSLMENSLIASRQQSKPSTIPSSASVNHSGDIDPTGALMEYDPLEMDRFTPIHLLSQKMIELTVRVRESTADIEFVVDGSTEVTRTLRQITGQLQEDLTKSRMIPFAQTADRLQRGVRDNGLKYGKQVELEIEGRDTLIDKVIVESLSDPLIHMVNNAIAHGIESPEIRLAAGKPALGTISVRALHQGNQTIISISDDGAGINTERVKAKAIEKGIITTRQALSMSKAEVYDLLFLPSFSTKDQADELAGRGVGMDVVRTSITEIRGTITTESQLGIGTTFTIRLPLALSIAKALIAVNNKTNIAFPMDGIEDTQDVSPEQIQTNSAGEPCIFWRDNLMPFKPLSDLLGFNRPLPRNNFYGTQEDETDLVSILILRSDGNLRAVQVDKIIGDQEIVIKPLQGPASKPLGVAGATVMGDGRIIPIADVIELIDLANGVLVRHVSTQWATQISAPTSEHRSSMVLIVDDSITVRELLSLTFKRAGYLVEQARDGQEAWDKLRAGLPCDIVFCDIEMPRMDGLEFLSRVQKDPALSKVPIAMLTSRGSDRHRQIAAQLGASGYFIKPYLEEALLDAAKRMIKGEVLAIV